MLIKGTNFAYVILHVSGTKLPPRGIGAADPMDTNQTLPAPPSVPDGRLMAESGSHGHTGPSGQRTAVSASVPLPAPTMPPALPAAAAPATSRDPRRSHSSDNAMVPPEGPLVADQGSRRRQRQQRGTAVIGGLSFTFGDPSPGSSEGGDGDYGYASEEEELGEDYSDNQFNIMCMDFDGVAPNTGTPLPQCRVVWHRAASQVCCACDLTDLTKRVSSTIRKSALAAHGNASGRTGNSGAGAASAVAPGRAGSGGSSAKPAPAGPAAAVEPKPKRTMQPRFAAVAGRINLGPVPRAPKPRATAAHGSVATSLKRIARESGARAARHTGRDDRATNEQVLDPRTRMILFKLLNSDFIRSIHGCVSTGKEVRLPDLRGGRARHRCALMPRDGCQPPRSRCMYCACGRVCVTARPTCTMRCDLMARSWR